MAEKRAEDQLKAEGWVTYRCMRGGRMYQPIDIFGVIDVVAKKEGWDGTLWVQVTTAKNWTHKFKEMLSVPWGSKDQVELWVWKGGRGGQFFEVLQIHPPPAPRFPV